MQRITAATIAAAALSAVLLTGCADKDSCDSDELVYYNVLQGNYHHGSVNGPLVTDADLGCVVYPPDFHDDDKRKVKKPSATKPKAVKPKAPAPAKPAAPRTGKR